MASNPMETQESITKIMDEVTPDPLLQPPGL